MATSTPLQTVAQTDRCPRCLGVDIDHSPKETYCRKCGFVLEDTPTDFGKEWRAFADSERDPERTKPGNRNRHDKGLGAGFTAGSDDLAAQRKQEWDKQARLGRKVDRNRAYACGEAHRMTGALDLPRYLGERAKHLFRRAHADGLNGADLDTVAAACLLVACRQDRMGRTAGDIAAVARSDEQTIRRRLAHLRRDLALEIPPPDVRQRIRVVGGQLPGESEAVKRALTRFEAIDDTQVAGVSPSVIAATLLYEAGEWTQVEVCDVAGVTPPSIRECREKL